MSVILETRDLNRSFGAVSAARDINIIVSKGETVGIIGANGAGKTTFVNIVTGYVKPSSGTVHFDGHDITRLSPRQIVQEGLTRSFQVPSSLRVDINRSRIRRRYSIRSGTGSSSTACAA